MPPPFPVPIGLRLAQTARTVDRAFDEALAAAGGTLPFWLILLNLKIRRPGNQRELAEAVGVREATLTHHLNAMDSSGLVTRKRDASNRRVQVVELTEEGEAAFLRLREAAMAFDARLRNGLSSADADRLGELLERLSANVSTPNAGGPGDASASDGSAADGSSGDTGDGDASAGADVADAGARDGRCAGGDGAAGGGPGPVGSGAPPWAGLAESRRGTRY